MKINRTKKRDRDLKITVKDNLNWVVVPEQTDTTDRKKVLSNVVEHREYLLGLRGMAYLPPKTINLYNESLKAFRVLKPYILEQDSNDGEYHVKLINDNGTKKYIYSHRDKNRLQTKLFELLLKSKVMSGLTIDNGLKELITQ